MNNKKTIVNLFVTIYIVIFAIGLMFFLSSCDLNNSKLYDELKSTFSQFESENEIGIIYNDTSVSFADQKLDLEKLNYEGELSSLIFSCEKRLVFLTIQNTWALSRDYTLRIYTCDYYGNNIEKIFSQGGVYGYHHVSKTNNLIYIESLSDVNSSERVLSSYNVTTKEYEYIGNGIDYDAYADMYLNDKADFDLKEMKNKITDEMLLATDEGKALSKYNYKKIDSDVYMVNGRIFISYIVAISGIDYLNVSFEYDKENKALEYNGYNFIGDYDGIRYIYLY